MTQCVNSTPPLAATAGFVGRNDLPPHSLGRGRLGRLISGRGLKRVWDLVKEQVGGPLDMWSDVVEEAGNKFLRVSFFPALRIFKEVCDTLQIRDPVRHVKNEFRPKFAVALIVF